MVLDDLLDEVRSRLPFQLPFLLKYVDDLLIAIPGDMADLVLNEFNSIDPHLQFTIEYEKDGTLPFLDTLVIRGRDNVIRFDWYNKLIASGRFLNFHSAHPFGQKLNIMRCMKTRVTKICHPSLLNANLHKLVDIFVNNGYPMASARSVIFSTPVAPVPDQTLRTGTNVDLSDQKPKYVRIPNIPAVTKQLKTIFKKNGLHTGLKYTILRPQHNTIRVPS